MKSICVYCGSSLGINALYAEAAKTLAKEMVKGGIALVYGGGNIGLMGVIADEVMRLGGEVTGIIPNVLMNKEVGHHGITKLHIVKDMHERKALMAELSDGFIAMPGGIGTLEELFEALTWSQLGLHDKPIGLLNVNGFYDGMLAFLRHQVEQGFLKQHQAELLISESNVSTLLKRFRNHPQVNIEKVLDEASARKILP